MLGYRFNDTYGFLGSWPLPGAALSQTVQVKAFNLPLLESIALALEKNAAVQAAEHEVFGAPIR